MSLSHLRTAILRHASVGPSVAALSAAAAAAVGIAGRSSGAAAAAGTTGSRGYAASASTYLDKDAVTSRVLSVVKAFDKVDPGKVRKTEEMIEAIEFDAMRTSEHDSIARRSRRFPCLFCP